MVYD